MEKVLKNKIKRAKEIWQHAGFQKYFRNTGWLFLGRIFSLIVSFLIGVYLARFLGPANYGVLNYVVGFVAIFSFIAGLGIDNIITRELVATPERKKEILGTAFYIKFFSGLFAVLLVFLSSFLLSIDQTVKLFILVYSFSLVFSAFNIIEYFFQSQVLSKKVVKYQFFSMLAGLVLKLIGIWLGLSVGWFIFFYLLDVVIIGISFVFCYQINAGSIFSWSYDKQLALRMIKNSWPLMLSGAAVVIYMKIDQVIIKFMLDDYSVGLYSVAVRLSEMWYFIPGTICASLIPAIVNAKKLDKEIYYSRIKRLYSLMIWLAIIIALPIYVLAPWLVEFVYGPQYIGAIQPLRIYVWSSIAFFLNIAIGQFLVTENKIFINFAMAVGGMVLNIILNVILIPKMGISGAALATLISYFFAVFLVVIFKTTRNQFWLIIKALFIR